MSGLRRNTDHERYDLTVEHTNPTTGERVVKRFYGINSQEGYAESLRREDCCKVKVTRRRRRK